MNQLPTCLEDIIYKYKHQLEFAECLRQIESIEYEIDVGIYTSSTIYYLDKFVRNETNYFSCDYEDGNFEDGITGIPELEIYSNDGSMKKLDKDGKIVYHSDNY